jgi:Ca-activated chloride channel family protein
MKKIIIFNKILIILFLVLIPVSALCDGFIIVPGHHRRPVRHSAFPLEVKYHHVDVSINDLYAETKIDQAFYNGSSRRLEGHYIFPIPKNAAIKKFSMFINGKEVPAELLSAKKARKIYEDIVRRQIDPALLEYYDLNIFKARIFPIEPFSTKRVKISYTEVLHKNNGTVSYTYPLNTEKFSSKPLKRVKIDISVKSKNRIKNLYSTTHDVKTVRNSPYFGTLKFEEEGTKPDKDFKIYYSTDRSKIGLSLLTHRSKKNDGFFFINISPDFEIKNHEVEKKNITFVVDVSGSMVGKKLKQAKKALSYCVNSLNKGDSFEIISFSTESEVLFGGLKKFGSRSLDRAESFIKEMRATGGTNIEEAITLALTSNKVKGRAHTIIFLTDGKPTIGKTKQNEILDIVKNNGRGKTKIFTFGIGEDINIHLLDKMTTLTNAYREYVSPEEDIEIKVSDFFAKISHPVLTDIRIEAPGIKLLKMYPKNIPDLYKGSSITVIGRYRNYQRSNIKIYGTLAGKKRELVFQRNFPKWNNDNEFIPSLWAARRIGFLLDQIRLNGESTELKNEVIRLARKYGIITPYTSYLIVEDEERKVSGMNMDERHQTLNKIVPKSSRFAQESKSEYSKMKSKFGRKSIRASKEVQALNKSRNYSQTLQGKKRMVYRDKKGRLKNLTNQIRHIKGRAIYNVGKFWVDSLVQEQKNKVMTRIQFNTKKYYSFIRKNPYSSQFLSLGKNVRFVLNSQIYEIYE